MALKYGCPLHTNTLSARNKEYYYNSDKLYFLNEQLVLYSAKNRGWGGVGGTNKEQKINNTIKNLYFRKPHQQLKNTFDKYQKYLSHK